MYCQVQKINDPYQHLENRLSTLKSGPDVMYFGIPWWMVLEAINLGLTNSCTSLTNIAG